MSDNNRDDRPKGFSKDKGQGFAKRGDKKPFSKDRAGKPHKEGFKKYDDKSPRKEGFKKHDDSAPRKDGFKKSGYKAPHKDGFKKSSERPFHKDNFKSGDDKAPRGEGFKKYTGKAPRKDGFKSREENSEFNRTKPYIKKEVRRAPMRERRFENQHSHSRVKDPFTNKARAAAWQVLDRVLISGGYSSIALSEVLNELKLEDRDKRLCTRIVYLTLEKLNYIDFALSFFVKEPEKLPEDLINLLRLSAAQLFFLDRVPQSAVVDEAVNLTRKRGYEELTSLVNGVLRSLIRQKDEIKFPKKEDNLREYLSICGSASLELVDTLIENFGEDKAEKILMFSDRGFSMTLRRNMMRLTQIQFEELVKSKPWKVEEGILP
ncbi:MAG: transcription antitermination factor NusB, partial [Eubacteriales bacterium]|nr:transcription antitermination factor NusB [Eubacteriales bacterium]